MKRKIQSLQGLRALAFLGILLQHTSVIRLGSWGVSFFFILSGYLASFSANEPPLFGDSLRITSSTKYAINRIKKIYPTHVLTMLGILILRFYSAYFVDCDFTKVKSFPKSLLLHTTLMHDWSLIEKDTLNGVSWFLSAMLFIYFITPFLLFVSSKIKTSKCAIAAIIITYLVQIYISTLISGTNNASYYLYNFPPYRAFDYFIGMLAGIWVSKIDNNSPKAYFSMLEFLSCILCVFTEYIYLSDRIKFTVAKESILFVPANVLLIVIFSFEKGKFSSFISNKYVVQLGNISGHMFLISQCVLYYLQAIWNKLFGHGFLIPTIQALICLTLTYFVTILWLDILNKIYSMNAKRKQQK